MSSTGAWSYRVLGEVTLARPGTVVEISAPKARLLLAVLVARANQVVSTDQLIEDLWAGSPPGSARTLLHGYVADLRRVLEPERPLRTTATILRTKAPGYVLMCDPRQVDAQEFVHHVRDARHAFQHHDLGAARQGLEAALALWKGRPFGVLGDEPALQPHRARLEELHLSAIEDRVMLDLREGREETLVTELDALVETHPLRERLWAALMLALYRRGRQADALAAYRRIARLLREELGADPGPELARTHAAVLRHDATLDAQPSASRLARPPRPTTAMVGRGDELARLRVTIRDHRLVTLTGPGGCGKTRLALELAQTLERDGPVAWVDLAPTRAPGDVTITAMTALGMVEQPGRDPIDTLVAQIAARRMVLVLDTCEHQVTAVNDLASALLRGCANLRILVTSRMALGLRGEVRWSVPPLTLPSPGADHQAVAAAESVQLFVDRAKEARPGFTLTPGAAADVAAICQQLDGIPLALELAAAWVAVLDLSAIRDQLAEPLDFLTRGSPTAPTRQQTLRAAIEWSHRLLGNEDRTLFAAVSVFAGSFSLDAAVQVCRAAVAEGHGGTTGSEPEILDRLANLQAASLLSAHHPGHETARFRLLDTIRQFGHEQLTTSGMAPTVRRRHAMWVRDLARRAEPELYGPNLRDWLARFDDTHADIRSALAWSLSNDAPALALDTAGALARYWMARAHIAEGRRWVRRALSADDHQQPAARLRALLAASFLASLHYDLDDAHRAADEAVALARAATHARGTAWALGMKGLAAATGGDADAAVAATQEALRLPGISNDPLVRGWTLNFMALGYQAGGDHDEQRAALSQSLLSCRQAGDPMGVEWALGYGGSAAFALGHLEEAVTMLRESLQISRSIGNAWGIARNLAAVALATEDPTTRHDLMRESLRTFGRLGDRAGVAFCLRAVAGWARWQGGSDEATALTETAAAIGADVRHVPVLGHLAQEAPPPGPPAQPGVGPAPGLGALQPITIETAVAAGAEALDRLGPSSVRSRARRAGLTTPRGRPRRSGS